jgi:adenylosuccinate lyase
VLLLYRNVAEGLVVYPEVIAKNLREELPFMATENVLMAAVAAGGDRQDLHERIREHSQRAAAEVKQHGRENDLLARLTEDTAFAGVDIAAAIDPAKLTGRSAEQVDEFLAEVVEPIRLRYDDIKTSSVPIRI